MHDQKGQSFILIKSPTAAAGGGVGNPIAEATTTGPKIISTAVAPCQPASGCYIRRSCRRLPGIVLTVAPTARHANDVEPSHGAGSQTERSGQAALQNGRRFADLE